MTLCKGAEIEGRPRRDPALARRATRCRSTGPNSDNWVGYMLIDSPRSAGIEVSAGNGPVSVSRAVGARRAAVGERSDLDPPFVGRHRRPRARTVPSRSAADGGRLHLATQNGPIAVALSGSSWNGGGLDARAVNGPVSLAVPDGYRSGTLVETLGRSPFLCHGDACAGVRRTWDDEHKRLELGDGPVVVRLSTENGPVSIRTGARDARRFRRRLSRSRRLRGPTGSRGTARAAPGPRSPRACRAGGRRASRRSARERPRSRSAAGARRRPAGCVRPRAAGRRRARPRTRR